MNGIKSQQICTTIATEYAFTLIINNKAIWSNSSDFWIINYIQCCKIENSWKQIIKYCYIFWNGQHINIDRYKWSIRPVCVPIEWAQGEIIIVQKNSNPIWPSNNVQRKPSFLRLSLDRSVRCTIWRSKCIERVTLMNEHPAQIWFSTLKTDQAFTILIRALVGWRFART